MLCAQISSRFFVKSKADFFKEKLRIFYIKYFPLKSTTFTIFKQKMDSGFVAIQFSTHFVTLMITEPFSRKEALH